jgi:hypothetical protein
VNSKKCKPDAHGEDEQNHDDDSELSASRTEQDVHEHVVAEKRRRLVMEKEKLTMAFRSSCSPSLL